MLVVVVIVYNKAILQHFHNTPHGIINLFVTHAKLIVKLNTTFKNNIRPRAKQPQQVLAYLLYKDFLLF